MDFLCLVFVDLDCRLIVAALQFWLWPPVVVFFLSCVVSVSLYVDSSGLHASTNGPLFFQISLCCQGGIVLQLNIHIWSYRTWLWAVFFVPIIRLPIVFLVSMLFVVDMCEYILVYCLLLICVSIFIWPPFAVLCCGFCSVLLLSLHVRPSV